MTCGEHAVMGNLAYLAGANLARWEIWDGMRAVDYLLTRADVDGERISITAVSYTHLDVYKRQIQGWGLPVGRRNGSSSSTSSALRLAENDEHTPVSYTHLDVYKRQIPV